MSYNYDEKIMLDKFVANLDFEVRSIKHFMQYMKFTETDAEVVDKGFGILKKKLKGMKNSESVSELKDYVKVDKVLKNRKKLMLE